MILRGQTSGAVATVNNVRLVADRVGTMIGAFLVPDGNVPGNPSLERLKVSTFSVQLMVELEVLLLHLQGKYSSLKVILITLKR